MVPKPNIQVWDVILSGNNSYLNILYDPQTNGPLLIIIEENKKNSFEEDFLKLYQKRPILIGNFISKKDHWINVIN